MNSNEEFKSVLLDTQYEIPSSINLYQIFTDNDLKKEIKHIAKYSYFLHLIYRTQKYTHNYVKLSKKLFRKMISYNNVLIRIKKNLVLLGIIEIDNYYLPHITSRKYKIKDQYMDLDLNKNLTPYLYNNNNIYNITHHHPLMKLGFSGSLINSENIIDKELINKQIKRMDRIKSNVNKASKNRFNDLVNNPTLPQYRYFQSNINKISVSKDVYQYLDHIVKSKKRLKPKRVEIIKDGEKIPIWRKDRFITKDIADTWKDAVDKVLYCIGHTSCSPKTNRLYNSITSYPSELRSFLIYNDEQLFYIDIRNSQPFLFLYFVLNELGGEITEDLKLYIDWVCSGMLYDNLMVEMGLTKDISNLTQDEKWDYDCKRAMFKIDFFGKVFFSNEKKLWEQRKVFNRLFPTVSSVITKMKSNGYKELSLKLQRFESSIILDKVFNRLAIFYPDSFCLPVHDAVICEKSMVNIVMDIMIDELKKAIGYKPELKVEKLE